MPNLFTLIGSSWDFFKSQPALKPVLFWFLIVPMGCISILGRMVKPMTEIRIEDLHTLDATSFSGTARQDLALFFLIVFLLGILITWGVGCVLIVGKRLITNRAGRARTSFRSVAADGAELIIPLILTTILRGCITFLWTLLLVVPGIIYSIRTVFYEVVIAVESIAYRPALQKSKKVVTGYTWSVFLYFVGLSLLLFAPARIMTYALQEFILKLYPDWMIFVDALEGLLFGFSTVLFVLSLTLLYGKLKKLHKA